MKLPFFLIEIFCLLLISAELSMGNLDSFGIIGFFCLGGLLIIRTISFLEGSCKPRAKWIYNKYVNSIIAFLILLGLSTLNQGNYGKTFLFVGGTYYVTLWVLIVFTKDD